MIRRGGIFSISAAYTAGTVTASLAADAASQPFQETVTEACTGITGTAVLAALTGPVLPTAAFIILLLAAASPQSRTIAMHIIFAAAGFTAYASAHSAGLITQSSMQACTGHCARHTPDTKHTDILSASETMGQRLKEAVAKGVPGQDTRSTASIAAAMATGDRSGITEEIRSGFSASGTMHLLALSGLHMGIIGGIMTAALAFVPRTRKWNMARNIAIAAGVWAYTAATGSSVSTVRAAAFITLRLAAQTGHRKSEGHDILALTAIAALAYDPLQIDDIGFQMSYGAVFGITVLYPGIKEYTRFRNPVLKKISESVAITVLCQLTSGTIAMYRFGTFPPMFLIANILAVPLATPIIILSILLLATADIPAACTVFGTMLHCTVRLMELINGALGLC